MDKNKKVAIFSTFNPFIDIFRAFDLDNFQKNQDRRITAHNIGQASIIFIMFFGFIVAMLCDAWYCKQENFYIAKIALPLAILFNSVQLFLTYISIRMQIVSVNEVITKLKQVVDTRKYLSSQ